MGWDGARVSVGGGSAGGNLALGAVELARRAGDAPVRACVLLVPSVDQTVPASLYRSPVGAAGGRTGRPFVGPLLVRSIQATYFSDAPRRTETLASPALLGDELAALPPSLVVAAERDSLTPQIERFVGRARAAGALVDYRCCPGVDHDFPIRPKAEALAALEQCARLMVAHLLERLG